MSIGGSFLETTEVLAMGKEVKLSFTLPDSSNEFLIGAVVRWTCPAGVGVQFGSLRAREVYQLLAFLNDKPTVLSIPPLAPPKRTRRSRSKAAPAKVPAAPRVPTSVGASDRPDSHRAVAASEALDQAKLELAHLHGERSAWGTQRAKLEKLASDQGERRRKIEAELDKLRAKSGKRDDQIAELRSKLSQRDQQIEQLRSELRQQVAELKTLRRELKAAGEAASVPADDLTCIRGIGPAFARSLRRLGVTRFEQIAAWTKADIDDMAQKLKTSPRRIQQAGWVDSAADLGWTSDLS